MSTRGRLLANLTLHGSLIPDADSAYDLGSPSKKFRSLYLSPNTLHLGDASLSSDGTGIVIPAGSKVGNDSVIVGNDLTNKVKGDTPYNITLNQSGDLKLLTGTQRWYSPFNAQISGITSRLGTAPTGSSVGIRVNINDSAETTWTFAAGSATASIADQTINLSTGDYLTVDITSIGSGTTGADLYTQFVYKQT